GRASPVLREEKVGGAGPVLDRKRHALGDGKIAQVEDGGGAAEIDDGVAGDMQGFGRQGDAAEGKRSSAELERAIEIDIARQRQGAASGFLKGAGAGKGAAE